MFAPHHVVPNRLLENTHLRRSPHPLSLQRTSKYASLLRISGVLHLGIFEQPGEMNFSANCLLLGLHRRLLNFNIIQGIKEIRLLDDLNP